MQYPYRRSLAFLFLALPACGHAPAPTPINESVGFGPGGAPLPDGRYALRPFDKFDGMQSLDIAQGKAALSATPALPLRITGSGPLWHLSGAGTKGTPFDADLLMVDGDRGWIFPAGRDHATDIAKIREIPQPLRGPWTVVPKIDGPIHSGDTLQLSSAVGVITQENGRRIEFPATWLQSSGDAPGGLMVTIERDTGILRAVAQGGLFALSTPNDGPALFSDGSVPSPTPLTLDALRTLSPLYYTGREAYDLTCGTAGCDLVELESTRPARRFNTVDSGPSFSLWLRQPGPEPRTMVLVPMKGRPLAVGFTPEAVALVKVAASAIPPTLFGTWQTSAVFPLDGFAIAEIRVDTNGVTTARTGERHTRAYLVQSAYDDGLLLLAHRAGSQRWDLWRLTRGRDRWYLSRWKDGAGPVVLWQGTKPAWIPATTKPSASTEKTIDGEPAAWRDLGQEIQKAALSALNQLWLGAAVFHESNQSAGAITGRPFAFPGKDTYDFTPDGCAKPGQGPSAGTWLREPWRSLNFSPPEGAAWMGFDFLSTGEGPNARFLAIVTIDDECSGKRVYAWRRGRLAGDDVEGPAYPTYGTKPPEPNAEE